MKKRKFMVVVPLKVEARDRECAYALAFDALNHLADEPYFAAISIDWDKIAVDGQRPS